MFQKPFSLLLQELITRQGSQKPEYQMQIQRNTDRKLEFSATLKFENYTVISTSEDENLAKENAARSLYCSLQEKTNPLSPATIYPIQTTEVMQELEQLCKDRNLPRPKFTITHIHSNTDEHLTYLAYCQVAIIQQTALGGFADIARIRAALKVYHLIQKTFGAIPNQNLEETFNKLKISTETSPIIKRKKSVTTNTTPEIINAKEPTYKNKATQSMKTKENSNTFQSPKSTKNTKSFKKCFKCGFRSQNPYHKL